MESNFEVGDKIELQRDYLSDGFTIKADHLFILLDGPFRKEDGSTVWTVLYSYSNITEIPEEYFLR
jgi:hypothetical protein